MKNEVREKINDAIEIARNLPVSNTSKCLIEKLHDALCMSHVSKKEILN